MGAYLSEPILEKQTESGQGGDRGFPYGATSMQGWRINQEDAHNCIVNLDEKSCLFAVYDGHGGAEVAQYAAMRFPDFLKSMSTWNDGRIGQALVDAFLKFDELLITNEVSDELKVLAGNMKKENESEDADEDKALLYEEACLPLDDVLRRYGIKLDPSIRISRNKSGRFISPKLKIKRKTMASTNSNSTAGQGVDGGGNGAPTPPSSPDAAKSTDADVHQQISTTTTEKCDASSNQELADTLPSSPPNLDGAAANANRTRLSLKRKSVENDTNATEAEEKPSADEGSGDGRQVNDNNIDGSSSDVNGINNETGHRQNKVAAEGAAAAADSASAGVGVPMKRFKEGMEAADSTTAVADELNGTSATMKSHALNGGGGSNSQVVVAERPSRGGQVDSTTSPENAAVVSSGSSSSNPHNAITATAAAASGGGNVGSPMMIEEINSTCKADDKVNSGGSTAAGNRSCAMDESSGASEDDEDEDFNMEVEDEESSDDSSDSDVIDEDDETTGAGGDEMGVDEDEAEAEEEDEGEEDDAEGEDDEMFAVPSGDTPGVDSGTTACVVVIRNSTIYVANAGDSRCVLCRGDKAVDLSQDHKPEDPTEKSRIEKAGGKITADGRVNGGLNLSRAIGDHFYKQNSDLPLRDQMITALPDLRVETMKGEDQFLVLACDGIWNSMSSQDVVDFVRARLAKGLAPAAICEQLCDVCLAPNTAGDGTGCDNMTAIVVLLSKNQSIPPPPSDNGNAAAAAAAATVTTSDDGDRSATENNSA